VKAKSLKKELYQAKVTDTEELHMQRPLWRIRWPKSKTDFEVALQVERKKVEETGDYLNAVIEGKSGLATQFC
jgi:hypothetical protein